VKYETDINKKLTIASYQLGSCVTSPRYCPLWGPSSLLFSGCQGLFPRGEKWSRCEANDFPSIYCWGCGAVHLLPYIPSFNA